MPTTSVEILIEADDKATAKLEKVHRSLEQNAKAFKETASKAKASTEVVGTFANLLGATPLGGFAGELAQVTERMSAFSEVSEKGGVGLFAFKAGLAAAVGVIAFKFGNAIGNAIFQTEKWQEELDKAIQKSQELANAQAGIQGGRYAQDLEALREIDDLEERRAAAQVKANELASNLGAKEQLIARLKKEIAERTETWGASFRAISGEYAGHTEILKQQLAEAEAFLAAGMDQKQLLMEMVAGENDRLELQKQQAAEEEARQQKSADYVQSLQDELELLRASEEERLDIIARRNTANEEDLEIAKQLLREKEKIAEEEERRKQAEQEARERQRQAEADRKQAAREAEQQAKAEADLQRRLNAETTLNSSESRLLTRSGSTSAPEMTAKHTERTAKAAEENTKQNADIISELRDIANQFRGNQPQLEVVG